MLSSSLKNEPLLETAKRKDVQTIVAVGWLGLSGSLTPTGGDFRFSLILVHKQKRAHSYQSRIFGSMWGELQLYWCKQIDKQQKLQNKHWKGIWRRPGVLQLWIFSSPPGWMRSAAAKWQMLMSVWQARCLSSKAALKNRGTPAHVRWRMRSPNWPSSFTLYCLVFLPEVCSGHSNSLPGSTDRHFERSGLRIQSSGVEVLKLNFSLRILYSLTQDFKWKVITYILDVQTSLNFFIYLLTWIHAH